MWALRKRSEQRLQIVLSVERITYVLFAPLQLGRYKVQAYTSSPLKCTAAGLIWYLPKIQRNIADFIDTHALAGASAQVVLLDPLVHETLIYTVNNGAPIEQLVPERIAHQQYMHTLLGPYEDHYLFYVAHVSRALLLQIELLFLKLPLTLTSVTPGFIARLNLYKQVKGNAFRAVELTYAIDHAAVDFSDNWHQVVASLLMPHATVTDDDLYYALGSYLGEF